MKLTHAEWQIMNALWRRHPATARDITDGLPDGINWAYTTVKTMLSRLTEKKAVREAKKGNASVYSPVVTQRKAQRTAVKTLVNQAFEGAFGPFMNFLVDPGNLTEKQRRELLKALSDEKSGKED